MAWFSLWFPLLFQLAVPLLFVAWAAGGTFERRTRVALAVLTALYLIAIGLAGLWLVLPWWLPCFHAALAMAAAARTWRRRPTHLAAAAASSKIARSVMAASAILLVTVIVVALIARRPPGETVDLAFPLDAGTYLVANGGNHTLLNAHLGTFEDERFRAYRGQSYGVDLVRIDGMGRRARGLLPADPRAYAIYGDRISAPCDGRVIAAVDGAPDMPPPHPDRSRMAGNHVLLDCAGVWVLLGHLAPGSVAVATAQQVARGQTLGRVGNSGNTGEPHLHIHAQRPGSEAELLSGDPLPIRLDGRYLVRNDRVTPSP
ncbi:MAG: M23 family metallopeptidase [Lautropia sp.]